MDAMTPKNRVQYERWYLRVFLGWMLGHGILSGCNLAFSPGSLQRNTDFKVISIVACISIPNYSRSFPLSQRIADPNSITSQIMATLDGAAALDGLPSTKHLQYAVPVTIESFCKGFVAYTYWAPRHWIPQIRTFYRALYTIESPHSSRRQLRRILPAEIIDIIAQYVKQAAVAQGFLDCEQLMGVLKTEASLEVEKGIMLMMRWGRWSRPFVANAEEDTVYLAHTEEDTVYPLNAF